MAFPNNGRAIRMNGDPDPGEVDRQECAPIFAGKHTAGLDRLPVPAIESEDPVCFRDGVPAFDIGKLAAMGLTGADMTVIQIAPQRLHLFCCEAHHRVLTLKTGSGFESATPAISAPCLSS